MFDFSWVGEIFGGFAVVLQLEVFDFSWVREKGGGKRHFSAEFGVRNAEFRHGISEIIGEF